MTIRCAINGLGRIGRALLRVAAAREDLEVVAANDVAPADQIGPLVARDSVHGRFPGPVEWRTGLLVVDGREIPLFGEIDPGAVPWGERGATVVIEATGRCAERSFAAAHLGDGVTGVLVAANLADADLTLCRGVNDDAYDSGRQVVVSNASCTTNCMAPVASVLHRRFGLRQGLLTTIHSYTRGQELLDGPHPDRRRARGAAQNIVPTSTGAARAVGLVLPELAGRLDAQAVRVPVPDVSMVQFIVELDADADVDAVGDAFREAAEGDLAGILGVTDEELVSSDLVGDPRSAIVDLPLLQRLETGLLRVVAWYDNEWGYANRLADVARLMGEMKP